MVQRSKTWGSRGIARLLDVSVCELKTDLSDCELVRRIEAGERVCPV